MRLKLSPNRPRSWKAFLLVGAIILSFSNCAKAPLPSRLIDLLTRDNIIRSPLAELEKSFESVALKFDENDVFIYENARGPLKTWAVPIPFSIGGPYEFLQPEELAISRNGVRLPLLKHGTALDPGWFWKEFSLTIHPEMIEEYLPLKRINEIELSTGIKFHSGEFFLPKGDHHIALFMKDPHPNGNGSGPVVKFFLNGKQLQEFTIDRKKRYAFRKNLPAGKYHLSIEHSVHPRGSSPIDGAKVLLDRIEISAAAKYLLFTDPEFNSNMDEYKIVAKAFVGSETTRKLCQATRGFELIDSGNGENPFQIKKKLVLPKRSVNALFAPPKSLYRFLVKVPESGRLRIGLAMAEYSWRNRSDGVIFNIHAQDGKESKLLFSKELDPYHKIQDRNILDEIIDLSPYENRKIELLFSTKPKSRSLNNLPFWVNPVVFSETENHHTNIILISIDTLRADHLGSYGFKKETSPNIDRIAEDGVLFKRCYSHSPSTLPSHMTMLTSLYPVHHKLFSNAWGANLKLDPSVPLLSDLLGKHGYQTAAFTGGGWMQAKFGFSNGFDSYQERVKSVIDTPEQLYEQARLWIDAHRNMPFFLFLHTYEVHGPYAPASPYDRMFHPEPDDWMGVRPVDIMKMRKGQTPLLTDEEKSQLMALYDGEIRYVDERFIAPLIAELKRQNLYNQTLLLFTSDHGEGFLEHGSLGHSNSVYDELLHVPLIIKFPDSKFRGTEIGSIVRDVDIVPTVLEVLNIDSSRLAFDGRSLMSILSKPEKEPRLSMGFRFIPLYNDRQRFEFHITSLSGHYKEHKLIRNQSDALTTNPLPPFEFYHFYDDTHEQIDLGDRAPALLRELHKKVDPFLRECLEATDQSFGEDYSDKNLEEQLRALGYIT